MHKKTLNLFCFILSALLLAGCGDDGKNNLEADSVFASGNYNVDKNNILNNSASDSIETDVSGNAGSSSYDDGTSNNTGSSSVGNNQATNAINEEYVRILPGTEPCMMNADYWIDMYYAQGGSHDVIMTTEQIESANTENQCVINVNDNEQIIQLDIKDSIDGRIVRELVDCVEAPKDPSSVYLNGKPTTKAYWDELHKLLNLNAINSTVSVRYGYSVDRQSLRAYPTNDFVGTSKTDEFFDEAVMSEFMPYLPLVIIHETEDGNWCYVVTYGYCGWIEKKYVAFCHSRDEWLSYMNPEDFLIVTGRELRLPDVQGDSRISGLLLPMGTILPLVKAKDAPNSIHGRTTYNNYVVKLKVRDESGYLKEEYGLISITEDVSIGYLPYTTENVLRQEFKLLGDRYGWAGLGHSNDCSGTLHMVYNCFGIDMPRTGSGQIALKGYNHYDLSEMSDEEKTTLISSLLPGSFLFFPGHIMMYIGTTGGEPFVISSVSTFATYDMPDGNIMSANTVEINSLTKTKRKSGKSWLTSMTQALELKP